MSVGNGFIERELPFDGDGADIFAALSDLPGAILLENTDPEAAPPFSVVAVDPEAQLRGRAGYFELTREGQLRQRFTDPFEAMRAMALPEPIEGAPPDFPFVGGLAGFLGYDLRLAVEELPDRNPRDSLLPDLWVGAYDTVILHQGHGSIRILARPRLLRSLESVERRVGELERRLRAFRDNSPTPSTAPPIFLARSNLGKAAYLSRVERILEYIRAGDVYQVNLTQRFLAALSGRPFDLYRNLRRHHPARYAAYFELGRTAVLSQSPECFLTLDGTRVETRPIKGTISRSLDVDRDRAAEKELLGSAKDRAELAMIVDLMRNDISRVCRAGTVEVHDHAHIESTPTVHHLVTGVTGVLEDGRDIFDLLRATIPGGSITGAPKIRAMEIIDELETLRRGVYTGNIGFIGDDGRSDLSIAIRTLIVENDVARIHGGGGIVIDSVPELEYEESVAKVRGLLQALGAEVQE